MTPENILRIISSILFLLPGILSLFVSLSGASWFFESGGTAFFRKLLGIRWTRILYFILGVALIFAGAVLLMNPISLKP